MPQIPPQTDTYLQALDVFDRSHPLRVDVDENLKVTGTLTPTGTQDVNIISSVPIPVTQSGSWAVSITGGMTIGTVDQGTGGSSPWLVNVNNFPATQPISGTVTANQGTSPWVVSGTITTSPNVNVHDGAGVSISSTGSSLNVDVTNTVPISGTITANQGTLPWVTSVSNFPATQNVAVVAALPAGTNVIGHVITDTGSTTAVTGNVTVVQPSGASLHVDVDNFPATQPVSGTVTANQGTSPWVVSGTIAATQSGTWTTGRTWSLSNGTDSVAAIQSGGWTVSGTGNFTVVQPTGTNLHTVLDSGTLTSITNALPAGTNVIGHVIADSGSTTVVTGNVTVVQPTGTNLHTVVDSGSITVNNAAGASAVNIQDGGNSITVDGTVTANQGTANTVANGWPIKITDGVSTVAVNTDGSLVVQPVLEYLVDQGKVFTLTGTFNAATSGSDNPILLIKNPNGSGKNLRLRRLYVGCSVTNTAMVYSIYYAPTIVANGTSQTPRNNFIGSATASVITAFSLPTLSSNGTLIFSFASGQNTTTPELNPVMDVQANQNIIITANPSSNNRAVQITAIWSEV